MFYSVLVKSGKTKGIKLYNLSLVCKYNPLQKQSRYFSQPPRKETFPLLLFIVWLRDTSISAQSPSGLLSEAGTTLFLNSQALTVHASHCWPTGELYTGVSCFSTVPLLGPAILLWVSFPLVHPLPFSQGHPCSRKAYSNHFPIGNSQGLSIVHKAFCNVGPAWPSNCSPALLPASPSPHSLPQSPGVATLDSCFSLNKAFSVLLCLGTCCPTPILCLAQPTLLNSVKMSSPLKGLLFLPNSEPVTASSVVFYLGDTLGWTREVMWYDGWKSRLGLVPPAIPLVTNMRLQVKVRTMAEWDTVPRNQA